MIDFDMSRVRAACPEMEEDRWEKFHRFYGNPPSRSLIEKLDPEKPNVTGPQQGGLKAKVYRALIAEYERTDAESLQTRYKVDQKYKDAALAVAQEANRISDRRAGNARTIAAWALGVAVFTALFNFAPKIYKFFAG